MFYLSANSCMPIEELDECKTIEEAMEYADEGAVYNGYDLKIYEDNLLVMLRRWSSVEFDIDEVDFDEDECIFFGSFGFYAPWEEVTWLEEL